MSGCSSNNDDAMRYFEDRYFAIEKVIDADTDFQNSLEKILSENADDTLFGDEYIAIIDEINFKFNTLANVINELKVNNLLEETNDNNLNRAYRLLIETYREVIESDYSQIVELVKNSDHGEEESNQKFNTLYTNASDKLNKKVDLFYEALHEYSIAKDLEIDLK